MKKLLLLFSIFLLYNIYPFFAQSSLLDSLHQALNLVTEDSVKVDLLDRLAHTFYDLREPDSASVYIEKAICLADVNHLPYRKAKAIYLKGLVLRDQGKDSLALAHLQNAKLWYEKSDKEYDEFYMHIMLGNLFSNLGSIEKATIHYDSAAIKRSKDNLKQSYDLNLMLGGFFWEQKKYDKARKYYLKNIQLSKQMDDSRMLYFSYADIGLLYNELEKPDSGIYYLEMALPVIQKEDPKWAASLQGCLGSNYKRLGNCEQALFYFHESFSNIKDPDASFACLSFAEMASCYLLQGDLEKADYYNDRAIHQLDQPTNTKLQQDAFKELISLYKTQGDYKRALLNLENLRRLEDELFKAENNAAIEELQVKYQTRARQNQMELQNLKLNRQSVFIVVFVILLVLLSVILFLGWRSIQHRQQTNKLLFERNEQLKELDLKKSRFFSNISHELRTPLTLIIAPLENTLDKIADKESKNNIQLAHRNSQRLLELVDEILDLSKLESGQMQLHLTAIHLEEVLRRIFFSFQSIADIRRLKLEFNSKLTKNIWVKTDLPKLEKMLNNLLSNAIKYSEPGGNISLDVQTNPTSAGNKTIIFQVTDTGKGIHQDDLPKIFNRYYQGSSGQLAGGTGIGLALTRELAHLFKGRISVKSEFGKGSVFTLALPFKVIEQPAVINAPSVETSSNKTEKVEPVSGTKAVSTYTPTLLEGQKPKILIVEDNPEMSRFLVQSLSPNYECTIAYNGKEALRQLETSHFDLVTSDVMMPQMDGFEFLENVRREGTVFKNIPFIMLTARTLEQDKLDGFQLGVDDYITKPFSVKELIARIQNLLKNKQGREDMKIEESADKKALKMAEQIVLDHFIEQDFGVHQLSALLTMSQRSLERLIKRLTGLSPVGFIREIRLQKAYQMLKRRQFLTVTEVRYAVGIENASYFNRKFKERFGVSPREVMGKVEI